MSNQTIFRNASAGKNFTAILNGALQDETLTPEAGWVLVFMLSQPTSWTCNLTYVSRKRRMGRDRVRDAVQLLCEKGYCKRGRVRKNNGRMGPYEYFFTDEPGCFGEYIVPAPDLQAVAPAPELPAPDLQAPYKVITGESNKKGEEEVRVFLKGGQIQLSTDNRAFWLKQFDGDDTSLDLALIEVLPYIQINSLRPLEAQVAAQLARRARDRHERTQRFKQSQIDRKAQVVPFKSARERKVQAAHDFLRAVGIKPEKSNA